MSEEKTLRQEAKDFREAFRLLRSTWREAKRDDKITKEEALEIKEDFIEAVLEGCQLIGASQSAVFALRKFLREEL